MKYHFLVLSFLSARQKIRRYHHHWKRSHCVILKLKNMSNRIPNYKSNKNIFFLRCFFLFIWIWIELQFVSANKCCVGHVSPNFNWIFLTFTCTFESFQFVLRIVENCFYDYAYHHNPTISAFSIIKFVYWVMLVCLFLNARFHIYVCARFE